MSKTGPRKVINEHDNSKIGLDFLAVIVVFGLFVVRYDQGIFSVLCSSGPPYMKYIHEFTHEIRYVSSFP
jgi:hypothetical protein